MKSVLPDLKYISHETMCRLEARFDQYDQRERLKLETQLSKREAGRRIPVFGNKISFRNVLERPLKLAGLYGRAVKNARDVQVTNNSVLIPNLPEALEGFKILQLSDMHIELSQAACERVVEIVGDIICDVCVMTGDYGVKINAPLDETLNMMSLIIDSIDAPKFGVLGNHDTIALVPEIEKFGLRILLNEGVSLKRDNISVSIAGVDDASYFKLHKMDKVSGFARKGGIKLLLSHSPDIYKEVESAGFDLMLCGHTHGGQICLPGRIPVSINSKIPRRQGAGQWKHSRLLGYTTTGVGTSIAPVRLNCPPEIVVHQLYRAKNNKR